MYRTLVNRRCSRFCLGVALVAALVLPARGETTSLLTYVPDDVVFCKVWERVGGAPEGPNLRNFELSMEDWIAALDDIEEWRILKKEADSFRSKANLPEGVSVMETLAGERSAIAVLGVTDGTGPRIPALLCVSQPKDMERAKAVLNGLFQSLQSYGLPLVRDTRWYEDNVIESLEAGMGLGLSYVIKGDLLLLCTSNAVFDRILDLPEMRKGQLLRDPDFIALQKELPKRYDQFSYFSWARLVSAIKEFKKLTAFVPEEKRPMVESIADQAMAIFGTVRANASVCVWDGETRRTISRTLLSEQRPEFLRDFLSREPVTYPILKMAPRKTETVWATNMLSLPDVWKIAWTLVGSLGPQGEMIRKTATDFQASIGFNIEEDLLSWMGAGWGFIKFPVDLESVVPMNHFALWVETTNAEKASAWLPKIVAILQQQKANLPLTVKTEEYEGRTCSSIEVPVPFFPYNPCMTVLDGSVLICTNPQYLREVIDVHDGRGLGLPESKTYKLVSSLFEKKSNFIHYVDVAGSVYRSVKTMERVVPMIALSAAHDKNAGKVVFAMRRLAKLFAILGVCQAEASSSSIAGDFIQSEKLEVLEDLPSRIIITSDMRGNISLSDIETWLPKAIRALGPSGQKELALTLAKRMGEWFPEKAEQAEKLVAEIEKGPEQVSEPRQAAPVKQAPESSALPGEIQGTAAAFGLASIPPRDPQASPRMIDLTKYYNWGLKGTWHPSSSVPEGVQGLENDLAELPTGIQTFAGVQFDVRGLIQLVGTELRSVGGNYPERVDGIEIGQKFENLHVLHATGWQAPEGTVIGSYILHYADGSEKELEIIFGQNVLDWWALSDAALTADNSVVAWTGSNALAREIIRSSQGPNIDKITELFGISKTDEKDYIRLFKTTWKNPQPDIEAKSIDFVSKMTASAPFLVAMTVE